MSEKLYRFESNLEFNKEVIKTIESNLYDMVGRDVIVDDLCNDISDYQNSDEVWIFGTKESMEFLSKYRLEAAEMFDDIMDDFDRVNPFKNPERFVCIMFVCRARELIASTKWVIDNSGATVRLTNGMVLDIVSNL